MFIPNPKMVRQEANCRHMHPGKLMWVIGRYTSYLMPGATKRPRELAQRDFENAFPEEKQAEEYASLAASIVSLKESA